MLAELHAGVQSLNKEVAVKSKFTIHNVKNEVSLSLCKYQPWCKKTFVYKTLASNRNFESCMSIRCLASQHILQFFHFCRGCFLCIGNFAHHCVVLLNAPLSNRDKKKRVCIGFLFPGNLGPKSVTLGNPVVLLACGSRRRDNLLAWGKLFASPYELKSRIWVWEEYNQFERCYRVCRLDRFLSNFA